MQFTRFTKKESPKLKQYNSHQVIVVIQVILEFKP